jgi:hypothetical protein
VKLRAVSGFRISFHLVLLLPPGCSVVAEFVADQDLLVPLHVPEHVLLQISPQPPLQPLSQLPSHVSLHPPEQLVSQVCLQPEHSFSQPSMQLPEHDMQSAGAGRGTVIARPNTARAGTTLPPALMKLRRSIFSDGRLAFLPGSGFFFICRLSPSQGSFQRKP